MATRVTLTIEFDATPAELAKIINDAEGLELTADTLTPDVVIGTWWDGTLDPMMSKIVNDDIEEV